MVTAQSTLVKNLARGIGVIVAVLVVMQGLADTGAVGGESRTGQLAVVRSSDSWLLQGATDLAGQNPDAAEQAIVRSINAMPVSQASVRALYEVQKAKGNETEAASTLKVAGYLGWRDLRTQLDLLVANVVDEEFDPAVDRFDALLRRSGVTAQTFPIAIELLRDPRGRDALLKKLSANPFWREDLYQAAEFGDAAAAVELGNSLLDLKDTDYPPTKIEISPLLNRMAGLGDYPSLMEFGRALDDNPDRMLSDGDYRKLFSSEQAENEAVSSPFDWQRTNARRSLLFLEEAKEQDEIFAFVRSSSRIPAALLQQHLRLRPGLYEFTALVREVDVVDNQPAIGWSVSCAEVDPTTATLLQSVVASEEEGSSWTTRRSQFEVPENCPIQKLALVVNRNSQGTAKEGEFGSVSIQRLENL